MFVCVCYRLEGMLFTGYRLTVTPTWKGVEKGMSKRKSSKGTPDTQREFQGLLNVFNVIPY